MGCNQVSISQAAPGRRRTCAGFKWRYAEAAGEDVDQHEARNPLSQDTIAHEHILSPVAVRRIMVELETRKIITVPFPQTAERGKRFRARRFRG